MTAVVEELRGQSSWCREFGSPFTAQVLARAALDYEAGGVVARLIAGWPGNPRSDLVSLRLAGALHAAALTHRDPALAAVYPGASAAWSIDQVWPLATAFLARDEAWVRSFMRSPPQTNETGRAAALAAGFLHLAELGPEPLHLLELGASAGLNLNWDTFGYAYPPWRRDGPLTPMIPTQVSGTPPPWRTVAIAGRAACDQNPLDPSSPDDRLRLCAYVWADQNERLLRLMSALDAAAAAPWRVEKADAAAWVAQRLAHGLSFGTTVVYHSLFLQYPPRDVRELIASTIEQAGRSATPQRRLAWLRFEAESILGGPKDSHRYVLDVIQWNGSGRTQTPLATVDPHGRSMTWLSPRPGENAGASMGRGQAD